MISMIIFNIRLKLTLITFVIIVTLLMLASNEAKANSDAKIIVDKMTSKIAGSFKNMETNELKDVSGYKGTNVKGSDMSLTEAEGEGALNRENGEVGEIFSAKATLKRQEMIDSQGFTKDEKGMPINNKGYLDKVLKQVKDAKGEFDYLKGEYADCKSTIETIESYAQDTCDQYRDSKINSCYPEQIVEIDAKYNYLCQKLRESKIKTCLDVITSIKCKTSNECDMGGIEKGSVESDMRFEYGDGVLTIGTIADNYWGGNCATYDRTTSFRITNKDKIKEFFLFNVGFDDYMQIILNDHLIYIGPDGGNKLEVETRGGRFWRHQVVNNGHGDSSCERNSNWTRNPNVDLKPYLREGENILKTRVIVSGNGEGWLQIRAKQNCCTDWDIKREAKCEYS